MVRLLLEAGANPVAEGWSGRFGPERRDDSPLARARDRELDEIVPQLDGAAKKPLRDLPDQPRPSPTPERQREDEMMRLAHRGNLQGAVGLLRDHPELAQAGLYEAVHQDHPALVRMLVERGAEPARPWRWSCWYTGPMHSLRYRRPRYETAEFLIEHGVTPDHTNGMGMTTLHILAAEGTVEAAGWLLDRGADLHPRDGQFDSTPLAWAARRGHGAIVERLRGVS
jgi:ankyrin repeat protein